MKRMSKLYTRLFVSILVLVLVFQIALIAIASFFYSRQSRKLVMDPAENTLTAAADNLSGSMWQSILTAYNLMYCQTAQDCMNMPAATSPSEAKLKRDALNDLMFVMQESSLAGMDYTVVADGPFARNYSTIARNFNIDYPAYDFGSEEWFREFRDSAPLRHAFYPNVSMARYAKSLSEPVHVLLFRSNNVNSLEPNGFVILNFTRATFDALLNALTEISEEVVVAGEEGEILYQSSGVIDGADLYERAQTGAGRQFSAGNGSAYIPLMLNTGFMGWTICCAIDATPINASLRTLLFSFVLVQLALLLSLLVLIYIVSRRLTSPLTRLADDVRGYHDGQLILRDGNNAGYCEEVDTLIRAMNGLSRQLDAARNKARDYQQLQQSTAFYALQQQVNPHFLFNTLDMIIGMASQGDLNAIIFACSQLSSMFRYSLSREATVLLRDEINYIRCYLDIVAMRSHNRIRGELDVDPGADLVRVPKLLLQPFVENSVKYGFDQKLAGGLVSVRVRRSDSDMTIRVEDNGCGFTPGVLSQLQEAIRTENADDVPNQHIGILNIYKRMRLLYGDNVSLSVSNGEEEGAVIVMRLPLDFPTMII